MDKHTAPLLGFLALVLILDVSSYFDSYLVLQLARHLRYEYLAVKTVIVALLLFLTWKYIPADGRSAPALFSSGAKQPDPLLTLRAFACLLVLMGHFFGVVFYAAGLVAFGMPMLSFLVSSPWGGLWVFFTLSGYLIGKGFFGSRYPINPQGVARFYVNRALRIYPVYAVAILLVIAIREPEMLNKYNLWMVWQILLLDYNSHLPINPIAALWSVSTEFQFYLLSPFLAAGLFWLCKTRRSALCVLVGLLALGAASRYAVLVPIFTRYRGEGWLTNVYAPMFGNIDLFLSGMILSKLLLAHPVKFKSSYGLWLGLLAMPLMLVASAHMGIELDYMSFGPAVFCAFALLCIWVFERTDMAMVAGAAPKLTAFLGVTQTFGILTYCVYAVHEPCYLALGSLIGDKITLQFACLIFLPFVGLIIALAYVLYRLVEKPFDMLRV